MDAAATLGLGRLTQGFAIPLAAGVLASVGVSVPPPAAALVMSISTIVVAVNAQFLRRVDLRPDALRGV